MKMNIFRLPVGDYNKDQFVLLRQMNKKTYDRSSIIDKAERVTIANVI